MQEAVIGLVGVVIGGAIGILGQFAISRIEYKKWKKERTIENLKEQKILLEKSCAEFNSKLHESFQKKTYDVDMVFNFMHLYPRNVSDAFDRFVEGTDKSEEEKKRLLWEVISQTKIALKNFDDKIREEIER